VAATISSKNLVADWWCVCNTLQWAKLEGLNFVYVGCDPNILVNFIEWLKSTWDNFKKLDLIIKHGENLLLVIYFAFLVWVHVHP
jgi:hypothetical protein